jgi:hypothetical protein
MPIKKRYFPGSTVTIRGSLIDQETGDLIAGAEVKLQQFEATTGLWKDLGATKTGGDGSYTFSLTLPIEEGTYRYRTYFPGTKEYAPDASPPISLTVAWPKAAKTALSVLVE